MPDFCQENFRKPFFLVDAGAIEGEDAVIEANQFVEG